MTTAEVNRDSSAAADALAAEPEETFIGPSSDRWSLGVAELWRCRDLLYFLTWRNVKVRYKQTALGAAWAFLQPVLMMVVFTWTLGRFTRFNSETIPYPLFVYAGLLPWIFFQTAVTSAANSVVASEGLVSKVYFPRLVIPLSAVAAAVVDFVVAFVMLLVLMAWYRVAPSWHLLLVPPAIVVTMFAALGVGTLIAALNVAYRDFRYVVAFLVQLWMFATPSIYLDLNRELTAAPATSAEASAAAPAESSAADLAGSAAAPAESSAAGETAAPSQPLVEVPTASIGSRLLMLLNPMIAVIDLFRGATLGTPIPWGRTLVATVTVFGVLAAGFYYFRSVEDSFADII